MNRLFYGDNLEVLRNHIPDDSVDLIYLDPPFNSNRDYNVLFAEKSGAASPAQMNAFSDTWRWDMAAESAMADLVVNAPAAVTKIMEALRTAIGENVLMAYLAMMAPRLVELHRVLKPTGSLYLHCDPTASHYLKIVLDAIFGGENFRNEIVWKRKAGRGETNLAAIRFGVSTDSILFYARSRATKFCRQYRQSNPDYIKTKFTHLDAQGRRYRLDNITSPSYRPNLVYEYKGHLPPPNGWAVSRERMEQMDADGRLHVPDDLSKRIQRKRYLDELEGETVDSLWDDISPINSQAGYPTQKPLALLERIITASSNPGDVVLDPFCGCGTAVAAAEKLGRQWVGIDITYLAITVMKQRFRDHFANEVEFEVVGDPQDAPSAVHLFQSNPYQFQWWAVDKLGINARPFQGKKKGSDGGIDGEFFYSDERGRPVRGIIQVKGGKTGARDIRDLRGTMEREHVDIGIFVSNQAATADMRTEVAATGLVHSGWTGRAHPKMQLLTVADLFAGKRPDIPYLQSAHAQAPRIRKQENELSNLELPLLNPSPQPTDQP